MATCLFTGETIESGNKREHVIPKALAGRLSSELVSSATFNKRSSEADGMLVGMYTPLMRCLSPLLPNRLKLNEREGWGRDGMAVVMEGDKPPRLKRRIVNNSPDGELQQVFANSLEEACDIVRQRGIPAERVGVTHVPLDNEGTMRFPWECSQLSEIAALKCALLTLDVLLRREGRPQFTRDASLGGVREFVRGAIVDGTVDSAAYDRYVMGLQFDKWPMLDALRHKHVKGPVSEFEHLIVASGKVGSKVLDVVWVVAGVPDESECQYGA
jgi:hypothetical protein